MTTRWATAVVVRFVVTLRNGDQDTAYFGPFLPHAGSATSSFIARLEAEAERSNRYRAFETFIEDVFVGPGESDCAVEAIR